MSNTKIIEIIKPYTNGFGRVWTPNAERPYNITRYPIDVADKLIALGVAVDMHLDGSCLFTFRRQLAEELGIKLIEVVEK